MTIPVSAARFKRNDASRVAADTAALCEWFGVEFIAARVQPEIWIDATGPCGDAAAERLVAHVRDCHNLAGACVTGLEPAMLVLSLPMESESHELRCAIGLFRDAAARDVTKPDNAPDAIGTIGAGVLAPLPAHSAAGLQQLGDAFLQHHENKAQLQYLENELSCVLKDRDQLCCELSHSYEEVTLLYRIIEHMKHQGKTATLPETIVDWLFKVIPARAIAIQLATDDPPQSRRLLTWGDCPLDTAGFSRILKQLDIDESGGPRVFNDDETDETLSPRDHIRQLVVAPLTSTEKSFGWIAAINHKKNEWFGTVEAGFLNSVAAIFSLHRDNLDLYQRQHEYIAQMQTSEQQQDQLQTKLHQLGEQLCTTYEEIHLLHEVAHNLHRAADFDDFMRMVLDHLLFVLPVRGVAFAVAEGKTNPLDGGATVVASGSVPVDAGQVRQLAAEYLADAGLGPIVMNRRSDDDWPFPEIRELVAAAVPSSEGLIGWLVAVNQNDGLELGSVEANLLYSVAGIVASHANSR